MKCETCNGSRLRFEGWAGPTATAPHPPPCAQCSLGMSAREIQVAQTEWLLDNQHLATVQQILARTAVMDAQKYGKVAYVPHATKSEHVPGDLLRSADLVVGAGKRVIKDRYGAVGYKLSETELLRISVDCDVYVVSG